MPVFLNSKSHLGLCTVAVLVASSCGLRTTLDSESSSPGTAAATPMPTGGTSGGRPDASAPGGGPNADVGSGPDLASLVVPDASTSDVFQGGTVPQPLGPDAGLRTGPDTALRVGPDAGPPVGGTVADARGPVPPDAGGRGPIGIGDSGVVTPDARTIRIPIGGDAGFVFTLPGGDGGFVFTIPGIDGGFTFGGGAGPGAGAGTGAGPGGGRGGGARYRL